MQGSDRKELLKKMRKYQEKLYVMFITVVFLHMIVFGMVACGKTENTSVGKVRVNIETYLAGQNQPTHPSVIGFDDEWNGYRYWMVYTPYPEANGEEENPSIAVSNDMYKWETPYGMVNPIANNEETGCNELKDGHILYRDDLNRIEVWYLGRLSKNLGGDGSSLTLFRKYSYDGITWSPYEIMDTVSYLSPTVRWDGSKYQMWSIGFDTYGTTGTFVYQESKDGINWTFPEKCSIGGQTENLKLWHGAVSYDTEKGTYIFVYIPSAGDSQIIEACESEDGIHFKENQTIIKNDGTTLWQRFYRPCLLVEKGNYHLFYGVITEDNKWYISYSRGDSLMTLRGITKEDCDKMVSLDSSVTDIKSITFIFRRLYHSLCDHYRPETGIIVVVLLFVNLIHRRTRRWKWKLLKLFGSIGMCLGYTFTLFKPYGFYEICGTIGAGILEGICTCCVAIVITEIFCKNLYIED